MKKTILLILMAISILMTGCWDKIEIEDRSFVLVIGVDKVSSENKEDDGKFLLSFVHPDTAKEDEGKVLEYLTFDVEADTFSSGINEVLQRFPKSHSYEHTKAIIFGKDIVEEPEAFKYILGVFNRNHEFHTSMLMYMTDGRAEDIFKIKPKMKTLLAYYITGIAENEKFAARIGKVTFLDLVKQLYDNDGDAVIPVLNAEEDELYSSYFGILKDYRAIGQLDKKETLAIKWINNKAKGGVIQLNRDKGDLPFLYHSFKRTIHLDKVEEGKIYIVYKMETEGSIEENPLGETLLNEAILSKHEKDYEEIIETRSKKIIEKMQKEYQVDLLGVREFLYKYYPRLFESISDDFTEYFEKDILIDVEAKVRIRRIGKTK